MLRHTPDKTKIIFFDLEYYVPSEFRERTTPSGMTFSPVLFGHKVLGGAFQTYYPLLNRIGPVRHIWEWRSGSESAVLQDILSLLQKEWAPLERETKHGSPMLGGIGISHSDVPVLLSKMIAHDIASHDRIYDLVCGCRQIDLSTATYCQFSFNHDYFAYPKSKAHLYQKYLVGKAMDSGKSVWELYEHSNYEAIENRSETEVADSISIYKAMFDHKKRIDRDLKRLKRIDKDARAASQSVEA